MGGGRLILRQRSDDRRFGKGYRQVRGAPNARRLRLDEQKCGATLLVRTAAICKDHDVMKLKHIVLMGCAALAVTACGKKEQEALDKAKADAKAAGEKMGEAAKDLGEAGKELGKAAADATKAGAEKAAAAIKEGAEKAQEKGKEATDALKKAAEDLKEGKPAAVPNTPPNPPPPPPAPPAPPKP